jgi:hypothetical protein
VRYVPQKAQKAPLLHRRRGKMRLYGVIIGIVSLAVGPACSDSTASDIETTYTVAMNGAKEVPARVTSATGTAEFVVHTSFVDYRIDVAGITNVTAAHIHIGASTVAGGILVGLYALGGGLSTGTITGQLTSGRITPEGLPSTVSLDSLKSLLRGGNSYVNVHTVANPGGEIRGQIVP